MTTEELNEEVLPVPNFQLHVSFYPVDDDLVVDIDHLVMMSESLLSRTTKTPEEVCYLFRGESKNN